MRLLIVADDLTGALDSACEAARMGVETLVFRTPASLTRALAAGDRLAPVVAVGTGSRDGDADAARAAMRAVVDALPALAPERVMKKVDSRLKGHVGVETAVLARALGARRVLAAPAIPDMGRVQKDGRLSGAGIATPIAVATLFADADAVVPDIGADADFDAAIRAAPDALPVGARGLAAALVRALWPGLREVAPPPPPGPALFAIGSRDPITLAQIAELAAAGGDTVERRDAPDGALDPAPGWRAPIRLATMTPGRGADPRAAGALFARRVALALAADHAPTLLACGGETADALLARLGADRLDIAGALIPGVALAKAARRDGPTLHLVTKSGGFGAPDALARLAAMIHNSRAAR